MKYAIPLLRGYHIVRRRPMHSTVPADARIRRRYPIVKTVAGVNQDGKPSQHKLSGWVTVQAINECGVVPEQLLYLLPARVVGSPIFARSR
jgi:hypothetical protein